MSADGAVAVEDRRGLAARLPLLAVLLLGVGMAFVFAGVAGAPLFRAGTWLLLAAFLVLAGAALLRALPERPRT